MRVALVHDWLTGRRGGELVLAQLVRVFPGAEIFTLLRDPGKVGADVESRPIHTSPLQLLPGITRHYRAALPLMPAALRFLDVRGFDLVVSSNHCVAKGIHVPRGTPHLAYVHSPMRYMWDLFDAYFGPGRAPWPVRTAARLTRPWLQDWDRRTAAAPDRMVANSHHVAARIGRFWGRTAEVVHPPVALERFTTEPPGRGEGGYFLWLGALAPYKRVDVAVEAFRRTGRTLWIAGEGQDSRLLARDLPPNVKWLGAVPDAEVPGLYRRARALVFPGEEDFGIAPLEAMATGRPVIALRRGGVLETVTSDTGLFFDAATPESLAAALERFEGFEGTFDPSRARARATEFSEARFRREFQAQVEAMLAGREDLRARLPW